MLLLFMLLLTHSETAPSYRRDINTERRHTLRVRVRDYQLTCDDRATTNLSLPQKSPLPGSEGTLILVNTRSASVLAWELLRLSEKQMPTIEKRRSTLADVAGQVAPLAKCCSVGRNVRQVLFTDPVVVLLFMFNTSTVFSS